MPEHSKSFDSDSDSQSVLSEVAAGGALLGVFLQSQCITSCGCEISFCCGALFLSACFRTLSLIHELCLSSSSTSRPVSSRVHPYRVATYTARLVRVRETDLLQKTTPDVSSGDRLEPLLPRPGLYCFHSTPLIFRSQKKNDV